MEDSRLTAGSESLSAQLPRLIQETELHKMYADEKMRAEKHRSNYQALKAEHTRLQDEYVILQKELKATIEECRLVQEKYAALLEQARNELASRIAENEQLRSQTVNPKMVETFKLQGQTEAERSFLERSARLEAELEKLRSENKKLKYDYNFLKSEFEHSRQEQQRIIEEMTLRNDAEVGNLRREREAMLSRQQEESSADAQHWRSVQRENIQLNLKVKGLLSELEELRSQREHSGMQADNVTRLQIKQLAEHSATIKALETEKLSLKSQCDSLHRELSTSNDENSRIVIRLQELERENTALRGRTEEALHRSKLDVTNIRVEMLRERGEIERERDRLSSQLKDAIDEIDVLKHSVLKLEASVVDKERDLLSKVQAAREEEWQKLHKAESERVEVETRLQEIERRRIDTEASCRETVSKAEERVRAAMEQKDAAEREALVARTKLENQLQMISSLESQRAENTELRRRLQRIESQYNAYVSGEREIIDHNEQLEREVGELRSELERARESLLRDREQTDNTLAQSRASWLEEKCNLQSRIDDLDAHLAESARKLATVTTTYKQKKGRMKSLVNKLRDHISQLQLKVEQLQIDKEALKRSFPSEAHEQLKKRLYDLVQRNREFRALLLSGQVKQMPIGGLTFGCMTSSDIADIFPAAFSGVFDINQKDLTHLRERLDFLDSQQRQQLEELKRATAFPVGGSGGFGNTDDLIPDREQSSGVDSSEKV